MSYELVWLHPATAEVAVDKTVPIAGFEKPFTTLMRQLTQHRKPTTLIFTKRLQGGVCSLAVECLNSVSVFKN